MLFRSTSVIADISGCKAPLNYVQGSLMMVVDVKLDDIDELSTLFIIWKDLNTAAWKGKKTIFFETTGGEKVERK